MPNELTVTELTRYLASVIGEDPVLQGVWVRGEISNFVHHSSGHMYFTLKDQEARIRCAMFRGQNRLLRFSPSNGQMVLAYGAVGLYEKNGDYQLYVDWLEPIGQGSLHIAFEELKRKLQDEGLFNLERKRPIPKLPQKIAIITSPTGAAIRDLVHILRRRRPNIDILLIPALVQGEGAPESLVNALNLASRLTEVDLTIIGRGGGSIEELWAFNDERVARAIAVSPHPIISAVGHETDFTIADYVADLRAPTPSAAAELAVPDQNELHRIVALQFARLERAIQRTTEHKRRELEKIQTLSILAHPGRWIYPHQQRLDEMKERLGRGAAQGVHERFLQFHNLLGKLDTLSPLATLARGYSIARRQDGSVLYDSDEVRIDENISVRLARGELLCRVYERKKEEEYDPESRC